MAINNVGSYTTYTASRAYRPAAVTPPAAPVAPYGGPSGGASAAGGGVSLGRLASWAGGAWAAWRYVLPMISRSPGGMLVAGVAGAGALAGNWVYNKLTGTGSSAPVGGGDTLKYASWAGGAWAAWRWVLPMIGRPTALVTTGVLGAGAFAGNWIYNKLTGR